MVGISVTRIMRQPRTSIKTRNHNQSEPSVKTALPTDSDFHFIGVVYPTVFSLDTSSVFLCTQTHLRSNPALRIFDVFIDGNAYLKCVYKFKRL